MEQAIFTNMCMVRDGKGRVLMQNRSDKNWPGAVFPGGHVEAGESFVDSVCREVMEETGCLIGNVRLCGVKQFPERKTGARYVVLLFTADYAGGEVKGSEEGEAFWTEETRIHELDLAPGFEEMLKVFREENLQEVFYVRDERGVHANWR